MSSNESLTSQSFFGVRWSYLNTVATTLLQLIFTAVLARLLRPEAFGLIAMSLLVLQFGRYVSRAGIGPTIVQKSTLSSQEIRAATTLVFTMGLVLTLLGILMSPIIAGIFADPDLRPVVSAMSLMFFVDAISTVPMALFQRDLRFKPVALVQISSYLIGYGIIGIMMAVRGFGVWSLVSAHISQSVTRTILAYVIRRPPVLPILDWSHYRHLINFGSRFSAIGLLEYVGANLDTFVVGRISGASSLGLYDRAFRLANVPRTYFSTSLTTVLFPSLSRLQNQPERLKPVFLEIQRLAGTVAIPLCLGVAASAPEVVGIVLGNQWTEAIPLVRILSLAAVASVFSHFGGILFESLGRLNIKLLIQGIYVIILGGLFMLLSEYGVLGFTWAVVLGETVRYIAYSLLIHRVVDVKLYDLAVTILPGTLIGISVIAAIAAFNVLTAEITVPVIASFSAHVALGVMCLHLLFRSGLLSNTQSDLKKRLSRVEIDKQKLPYRILQFLFAL